MVEESDLASVPGSDLSFSDSSLSTTATSLSGSDPKLLQTLKEKDTQIGREMQHGDKVLQMKKNT